MLKNTETLPVSLLPSPGSPVGGVQSIQLTVTVDKAPTEDTTVQVDTGDQSLLVSPSGTWPYQAPVAAGALTTVVTLATEAVATPTPIQIRSGKAGANMNIPLNWSATVSVTIMTP